jgi:ribonuclease HII
VGVVVIDEVCRSAPAGVRDSKLLSAPARERMVAPIRRWAHAHAVGHASPVEIDQIGIIAALRLAGVRALAALPVTPDLVILDGNHDWLTAPEQVGLLGFVQDDESEATRTPPVTTMIKADLRCSSVAAASVLAKVERDGLMVALGGEHPAYRWEINKGVCRARTPRRARPARALRPAPAQLAAAWTWLRGGRTDRPDR